MVLSINNLFRIIRSFLTLEIIILLSTVWMPDSFGLAAAELAQISNKQVEKRVESGGNQNPISQITTPIPDSPGLPWEAPSINMLYLL